MRIIKPSYKIIGLVDEVDTLRKLEEIIRVCYKSEDKITDISKYDFLDKIVKRKHHAMLEHANFTFSISDFIYYDILINHDLSKWMKTSKIVKLKNDVSLEGVVTLSARSILDMLSSNNSDIKLLALNMIIRSTIPMKDKLVLFNVTYEMLDNVEFVNIFEVNQSMKDEFADKKEFMKHSFISIKFICDRGVSHELVRHRCAFAQESTRYCDYSKDKFDKSVTFIKPCFWNEKDIDEDYLYLEDDIKKFSVFEIILNLTSKYKLWKLGMWLSEKIYFALLSLGAQAQEARSVLTNSTKTEIVVTMSLLAWNHFMNMRVPASAHPQMRELTVPLYEYFQGLNEEPLFNVIDY